MTAGSAAAGSARVAIVHERFTEFGGSERVVEELHALWPNAPVFVPICERATLRPALAGADIRVSALGRLHRPGGSYAPLLPLLPAAMGRFDLREFDVVVTSHHAFANRIRVRPGTPIVSYTHTPARWLWEAGMRRRESGRVGRPALEVFAATQRPLDRRAAARLHTVVANSHHVAARIERWWGRPAHVVAPPVDVDRFTPDPADERDDFFLLAGRLVPYKQPEVAVEAATRAGVRLVVAGEGRSRAACEAVAGPAVEFLGRVDDDTLLELFRRCRAALMPGEEDFGIVPVEAQACGAPVVALATGGALDTVIDNVTGRLYPAGDDPVAALAVQLRTFDPSQFDPARIREHALRFSPAAFGRAMTRIVGEALEQPDPR